METYIIKCSKCEHVWKAKSVTPKHCPKCNKSVKYANKYVKSFNRNSIRVSDRTYSMLLRRKKSPDELLSTVIKKDNFDLQEA